MIVDILEVGKPTKSKKIYPLDVLESNIERLRETIDRRAFMGELGCGTNSAVVQLANASHLVTDLWIEDGKLRAEVELLDSPAGKVLHRLLDSCIDVKFSLVGVGSGKVNDNGELVIGDSYKMTQIECWAENSTAQHQLFNVRLPKYHLIDEPWTISEQS